jgi:long-chain fatty acid transport protein
MKVHRAAWHLLLGALALPAAASAQGFGLNEIGSCAIARGFAATSGGCRDASLVYWNPAAITTLKGRNGLIGVAPIAVSGDFTQDTTGRAWDAEAPVEFPPHLFWSTSAVGSRHGYGIGVYVPYGLTTQWPNDFPGRFSATRAGVQTIYVQPTWAYALNDAWSVGVGPVVGHSAVELGQAVDLSEQTLPTGTGTFANLGIPRRTEFARAEVKGDAWGFGFTAGVYGQLSENWRFGARYLHGIDFEYEGEANFTQTETNLIIGGAVPNPANPSGPPLIPAGTPVDALLAPQFAAGGALATQDVTAKIAHPAQAQFGFTYTGYERTELTAEYTWLGWKAFKTLEADFDVAPDLELIEDYNNSSSFRFGAEHRFLNGWAGRFGLTGSTSAAPEETVTALLPEQDRYTINLGAGIPLTSRWVLDAGYAYVGTWGSRGRIDERSSRSQTAEDLNTGFYRLNANIFAISLKATY